MIMPFWAALAELYLLGPIALEGISTFYGPSWALLGTYFAQACPTILDSLRLSGHLLAQAWALGTKFLLGVPEKKNRDKK